MEYNKSHFFIDPFFLTVLLPEEFPIAYYDPPLGCPSVN